MATKYYRTPHLVYDCKYHVIFCQKYRRRILVNGLDELVKTVFRKIAEQKVSRSSKWKSCRTTSIC